MKHSTISFLVASMLAVALAWPAAVAEAQSPGVTLYNDGNYGGRSQTFYRDEGDLRRSQIGADQASSVRVDSGCRAILYSDFAFRGQATELTYNTPSLKGSAVGNDSASSLRVICDGTGGGGTPPPPPPSSVRSGGPDLSGATMFWRPDFHGRSHFFHQSVPDIGSTPFGHDQATSIILDQNCRVTLYEHPNYRGRSVTLNGQNSRRLGETSVGDNTVSSLQVSCR